MNSQLPSPADCWERLHQASPPAWVIGHTECVVRLATSMADHATKHGHGTNRDLIEAGAILHDFGRSVTQDPTHAHIGAELLRSAGLPGTICRIVERHTGAGLTASDAADLGLPPGTYVPETLEEKIVGHADNLWSGTKRLELDDVRRKYEAKGLDAAWHRIASLHAELARICGRDPCDINRENGA